MSHTTQHSHEWITVSRAEYDALRADRDAARAELDMVHRENGIKLGQILDLEDLLYSTRIMSLGDGSPCWCCLPAIMDDDRTPHEKVCQQARQATRTFWGVPLTTAPQPVEPESQAEYRQEMDA